MGADMPDYERLEELSDLGERQLASIRAELTEFQDRVYWLTRQIPAGRVATYGQLALMAGSPRAARAVGNLMRSSLDRGITIPWHRVLNAQGRISGRGDLARTREQRRRLEAEGIDLAGGGCNLEECRWEPDATFWELDD